MRYRKFLVARIERTTKLEEENMESPEDKYRRVQLQTWDLSEDDKAALLHVLGLVSSLANTLAETTGETAEDVLRRHHELVDLEESGWQRTTT